MAKPFVYNHIHKRRAAKSAAEVDRLHVSKWGKTWPRRSRGLLHLNHQRAKKEHCKKLVDTYLGSALELLPDGGCFFRAASSAARRARILWRTNLC